MVEVRSGHEFDKARHRGGEVARGDRVAVPTGHRHHRRLGLRPGRGEESARGRRCGRSRRSSTKDLTALSDATRSCSTARSTCSEASSPRRAAEHLCPQRPTSTSPDRGGPEPLRRRRPRLARCLLVGTSGSRSDPEEPASEQLRRLRSRATTSCSATIRRPGSPMPAMTGVAIRHRRRRPNIHDRDRSPANCRARRRPPPMPMDPLDEGWFIAEKETREAIADPPARFPPARGLCDLG